MRNVTILALSLLLVGLTAFAVWFSLRPEPPTVTELSLDPAGSTCPGGSVRFGAVVTDAERWILREDARGASRDLVRGDTTTDATGVLAPVSVCPPSDLCLKAEGPGGSDEACLEVPVRDGEWIDRLIFEPACPELTYSPLRIAETEPEGHRTILSARNASPDTITLIHETDDGSPVSERVGPGEPFTAFTGRSLHGRWSIDREATPDPGVVEECRPPDLPLDAIPPPGVAWLAPIEILVVLECAPAATSCSS